MTPARLPLSRPLMALTIVTVVYVAALVWIDAQGTFARMTVDLLPLLGGVLVATASALALRFARWHWLLGQAGYRLPIGRSLQAYLAGFAFTASPGKVGELIRIRYLSAMRVPDRVTFGLFLFERSLDLVAVLALACLAVPDPRLMLIAAGFVLAVVAAIGVLAFRPGGLRALADPVDRAGWPRLASVVMTVAGGFAMMRQWLRPVTLIAALLIGALAWSLLALVFAWLLNVQGLQVAGPVALAIYPLAMLAGAASMIPGGLGSTEAAIVVLLMQQGVDTDAGMLVAVLIRIGTLWSAIVVGVVCLLRAERQRPARRQQRRPGTVPIDKVC